MSVKLKVKNPAATIKPSCYKCNTLNPQATGRFKCAVQGTCPALPPRDGVEAAKPISIKSPVASKVRALLVGETVILESKNISKTQAAAAAAASKLGYALEQKGYYAVAGNGDMSATSFVKIKRIS